MSWTDEQIDDLYRRRSEDLSFEYKDSYWQEMDSMLSEAETIAANEAAADAEVDALYQAEAEELSFTYKPQYWSEFEALLPRKRRLDFLWFFTSLFFIGFIGVNTYNSSRSFDTDQKIVATTTDEKNTSSSDQDQLNDSNTEATSEGADNVESVELTWDPSQLNIDLNWQPTVDPYYNQPYYSVYPTEPFVPGIAPLVNPISEVPGIVTVEEGDRSDDKSDDKKEELQPGSIDQLPTNDLAEIDRGIRPYDKPVSSIKSIYIQGVGGFSQSLITPSEALSHSYGMGVGFKLQNKNFSFGVGVNGLVSNHDDLILNRSAKVYGFGSEIYKYNIDYKQLYLLEGNIEFGYSLKRHTFKLGVRPSYAMSSKVRISEKEASYGLDVLEINADRNVYGYMDGLRRFGIRPTIGYSFSLSPTMELGLNIGTQLMPQVNDEFLDGENNKLPIDGQIYFRKSLRFGK